jgi:hypothetical protein
MASQAGDPPIVPAKAAWIENTGTPVSGTAVSQPDDGTGKRLVAASGTVENGVPIENTQENSSKRSNDGAVRYTRSRNADRKENTVGSHGGEGPTLARDAAALLLIVRLRIVSISQIAPLAFPGASIVVARRRLRHLREAGFLSTWDRPSRSGAATRYVYPTKKALLWSYRHLLQSVRDTQAEKLVTLMMPVSTRRLVALPSRSEPLWFAHQDEINKLVLRRVEALGPHVVWWSTWDCPFPDRLNGLKAPQPDYILLISRADGLHLVFGEHDRNTEDRQRWMAKLGAYAAARVNAREHFGLETFTIDITVSDPVARRPLDRIHGLVQAVQESSAASYVRLSLAGWAHATPEEAVWFAGGEKPTSTNLARETHTNLQF